ncbi:MAG TPA: glycine--tRNA ligase subunit beta, partial [Allosphingosinicella sp.]|nr:glycine--tRNA ligase subunit beta [Allosphingosinicella sp.]
PQALEGFLRKTGLTREQLEERGGIFYAIVEKPGRSTASVLAEAIPAIVRAFPWPKSMRWGAASVSTESPRWVRPLQGIVALLGEEIVDFEIGGVRSGAATVGHRFHHPGIITIGSANDYAEKLRACHVLIDPAERRRIIAEGAAAAAREAGLTLVEDEGLLAENAGLTEWPVPLLGSFDPSFLDVPPEVIQLTMRTNQKYFALQVPPRAPLGEGNHAKHGGGVNPGQSNTLAGSQLAPNFICTANIEAADGGAAIVAGNEKVLAARLSDAKYFWEQDLKVPLKEQADKLNQIVFHEKLGTVADKVERVAKLARWLVEEGIVTSTACAPAKAGAQPDKDSGLLPSQEHNIEQLATLAETAARLSKADLVTGMVGEFPELQGIIGGYLARAQGHPPEIADAIRDHYKPVGQGDEVPRAPVTVAVSLADKLDTIIGFFAAQELPSGSKDPFALRRAAIAFHRTLSACAIRLPLERAIGFAYELHVLNAYGDRRHTFDLVRSEHYISMVWDGQQHLTEEKDGVRIELTPEAIRSYDLFVVKCISWYNATNLGDGQQASGIRNYAWWGLGKTTREVLEFLADRLKVQQREAGVRHDLIDAVFALGEEDDLVRLLARVKALQSFVETPEGADLLAGYKRASNILKKEGWATPTVTPAEAGVQSDFELDSGLRRNDEELEKQLSYAPLPEEAQLIAALDAAEPKAAAAVEAEDFEGAMAALASLRAPVDSFFDKVTVNDPDPAKREARLNLLARMRDAVHRVADFSRIEG